jgi:hypothetical protein
VHNSSHTYTHILAGCWCSPQTNQDSLFLSLPTWRLFCLTSKMGEIKKKRKRWVIYLRVYSFVCVCIVISSQVNIEPGLSLFNRWCYSSVVLFFFSLSFSMKLSKDWLNFVVMVTTLSFSYRLCHYKKTFNNRQTKIGISEWL